MELFSWPRQKTRRLRFFWTMPSRVWRLLHDWRSKMIAVKRRPRHVVELLVHDDGQHRARSVTAPPPMRDIHPCLTKLKQGDNICLIKAGITQSLNWVYVPNQHCHSTASLIMISYHQCSGRQFLPSPEPRMVNGYQEFLPFLVLPKLVHNVERKISWFMIRLTKSRWIGHTDFFSALQEHTVVYRIPMIIMDFKEKPNILQRGQ